MFLYTCRNQHMLNIFEQIFFTDTFFTGEIRFYRRNTFLQAKYIFTGQIHFYWRNTFLPAKYVLPRVRELMHPLRFLDLFCTETPHKTVRGTLIHAPWVKRISQVKLNSQHLQSAFILGAYSLCLQFMPRFCVYSFLLQYTFPVSIYSFRSHIVSVCNIPYSFCLWYTPTIYAKNMRLQLVPLVYTCNLRLQFTLIIPAYIFRLQYSLRLQFALIVVIYSLYFYFVPVVYAYNLRLQLVPIVYACNLCL